MLDFLYVVQAVVLAWRFLLCVALAMAVIIAVFWLIPDPTICASAAVPAMVAAFVVGFVWQWRIVRGRAPR
jgi:hypothetical protein